jgi:WD40 repeat protein
MAVSIVAYSPNGQHFVSGSWDITIHVWGSSPRLPTQLSSSCNPAHADCFAQPDAEGWVRDSKKGLLYWVPPDCRAGLHAPTLLTIPPTSHTRSVSLDFQEFAFGTRWTQIFNSAQA